MSKLQTLADDWGFEVDDMLAECVMDSVNPGICINEGCDYSTEVEPDQDHGWCECCHTNTVKSALMLAGLI